MRPSLDINWQAALLSEEDRLKSLVTSLVSCLQGNSKGIQVLSQAQRSESTTMNAQEHRMVFDIAEKQFIVECIPGKSCSMPL